MTISLICCNPLLSHTYLLCLKCLVFRRVLRNTFCPVARTATSHNAMPAFSCLCKHPWRVTAHWEPRMMGSTVRSGDAEARGRIRRFPRDPPEPGQGEPETEHICVLPAAHLCASGVSGHVDGFSHAPLESEQGTFVRPMCPAQGCPSGCRVRPAGLKRLRMRSARGFPTPFPRLESVQ